MNRATRAGLGFALALAVLVLTNTTSYQSPQRSDLRVSDNTVGARRARQVAMNEVMRSGGLPAGSEDQWQRRLQTYREQRAAIEADTTLSGERRDELLAALVTDGFSEAERPRVLAVRLADD